MFTCKIVVQEPGSNTVKKTQWMLLMLFGNKKLQQLWIIRIKTIDQEQDESKLNFGKDSYGSLPKSTINLVEFCSSSFSMTM